MHPKPRAALIIGAGAGLSGSLARLFNREGVKIALAARNTDKLRALADETGAVTIACDAGQISDVKRAYSDAEAAVGPIDAAIYNPSRRVRGDFLSIDPAEVQAAIQVTAMGGMVMAQEAAKRMVPQGHGTILFTGASAGWKGFPKSTAFAMGKFALRGLAQSIARELQPQGIHVACINIDGGIQAPGSPSDPADMTRLDPDAIAETYWHLIRQPKSTWSTEVELRPAAERF